MNITAELDPVSGAWIVCSIIRGYLIRRRYFGYTRQDAIADFRKTQNPCHTI